MQSQKAREYGFLSDSLFSVSEKVQYVAFANVLGEIIDINHCSNEQRYSVFSKEKIAEDLRRITLATNVLTFENIRLMVLDTAASKVLIINLARDTIIVALREDASLSDFVQILSRISKSAF